jgi:Family of unknown function (DUF6131)
VTRDESVAGQNAFPVSCQLKRRVTEGDGGISRAARLIALSPVKPAQGCPCRWKGPHLIILGVVLVVVGLVAGIPILETIGFLWVVVGVILWILGAMGRAVGGRKHYY